MGSMKTLFNRFPREFGVKRTFVKDNETFVTLINKFNGIKDCYSSIYPIIARGKRNITSVDKIFFDLDKHSSCWGSTYKLHNWLIAHNYKHIILLSGGGFHVYVFTVENTLKHPKQAIYNAQHHITKQAGITIGKPNKADVDEHVIGDVARIARIPNTWNLKRKRFCIYITPEDLNKSFEDIKQIAKTQRFETYTFGNELFDLTPFDTEPAITQDIIVLDTPDALNNVENCMKLLPPLIRRLLLSGSCGWNDRYIQVLAMRESGLPYKTAVELCRKHWSPQKFKHAMIDEENQIGYVYGRGDLFFPAWTTLQRKGYTITKDDLKFDFYK